MQIKNKLLLTAISVFFCVFFLRLPVWGQAEFAQNSELSAIKVAMSDDQSIIIERMLYECLKRAGYQMIAHTTGMRTAVADVNYGDAVILPAQTDGWDKRYPNLIKVPVAIDIIEFTAYVRSDENYNFSAWQDIEGLKLGYRWQNEYVANNVSRARAGKLVTVNSLEELWMSLLNKEIDAALLPRMSHYEYRYPHGIKRAGVIERQPVYTYVNNKYTHLVPLLERGYKEMLEDGTAALLQNTNIKNTEEKIREYNTDKRIILYINSYNAQNEWERGQMESIRRNIESFGNTALEYYNFYLNSNEFHSRASINYIVSSMIRAEFVTRHPDLIIASGDEAFEYVLSNYYLLFPNLPVLFTNVIKVRDYMIYGLEKYITGVSQTVSFNETVLKMLDLFPETNRIYILNDYSFNKSKILMEDIKNNITSVKQSQNIQNELKRPVEFIFNDNKPFTEIIDDIHNFESDTLVLIGYYLSDSGGVFYSEGEVQKMVSNASKNPVFCLASSYIRNGVLGGLISNPRLQSEKTASMALEILKGTAPSRFPIVYDSSSLNQWQFDHEVIKKFKIKEKDLPKDHIIINCPIPIWESNPNQFRLMLVLAALSLFVVSGMMFFLRLAARKEADENMHILLDALPMCCQLWNKNLKTIDYNRAALDLFGFKVMHEYFDMFIGSCSPEYQPDGQNSEKKAHMLVNKAFEEGYCKFEWMHRNLNGELLPSEITLIRVKHNKEGYLVAGYMSDLRDQKEFIGKIEKAQEDLRSARDAAETANRTKTAFLTNLSHEIRTPMNSIVGFAELAQLSNNPEKMKEYLSNILQSSKWLLKIINDILDISKIESGKIEPKIAPVDLQDDLNQNQTALNDLEKPNFEGDVLVCEDNKMNQQVIYDHLKRVGLKTIIAHNGREGINFTLDRIKNGKKPFDLIFMDIHMPEIDGIEAASKITALGVKSPIIALTANIMPDEIETYRKSGMSDCLGKPFTSQELWKLLVTYLSVLYYSEEEKGQSDSIPDISEKDKIFQKQLQTNFVRNNQSTCADIITAAQNNDIKLAHRLAHTLKTNAGQIRKSKLQEAAAAVEGILAQDLNPLQKEELTILEKELKLVLAELSPLIDEINASKIIKINDAEKIRGILTKLEPMLVNKNPECEELIAEIHTIPGAEELALQIDKFNFKQAVIELSKLKKEWE